MRLRQRRAAVEAAEAFVAVLVAEGARGSCGLRGRGGCCIVGGRGGGTCGGLGKNPAPTAADLPSSLLSASQHCRSCHRAECQGCPRHSAYYFRSAGSIGIWLGAKSSGAGDTLVLIFCGDCTAAATPGAAGSLRRRALATSGRACQGAGAATAGWSTVVVPAAGNARRRPASSESASLSP